MASGLWERVRRLEDCAALVGEMLHRMRYLSPTMGELVGAMARQERYAKLLFLERCSKGMAGGIPFPLAWRAALEEGGLGREETDVLLALGGVLGQADLDSQVNALTGAREQLERRGEALRGESLQKGKLYRTMGVLGGAALVIILL